jgi:hypothetical protein
MNRGRVVMAMFYASALGAVLVHAAGCTLADFLSAPPAAPPPPPAPPPQVDMSSGLAVSAIPVYRLIVAPALADAPSRLLVFQLRLTTSGDAALSVSPEDLALVLANGQPGRIFDRARAVEILRRTTLGDADLSYVWRNGEHPSGGLSQSVQPELTDLVSNTLLSQGVFINGQTLQGYVVADTGTPLTTLEGVTLDVTAYRLRDAAPAHVAYQFATVPPTAEAH